MAQNMRLPQSKTNRRRASLLGSVVLGSVGIASVSGAFAQTAPLDEMPTHLGVLLDTANQLSQGALQLTFGFNQTDPSVGTGTGNQIYFINGEYGLTDRLSFGLWGQTFQDPTIGTINGTKPDIGLDSIALSAKYHVLESGSLNIAVAGSVELFRFATDLYFTGAGGSNEGMAIGSVSAPITYSMNEDLQFHFTPGVSIFPESINGVPFYGTIAHLGLGATYRLSERLSSYAAVDVPVSGGNSISSTGAIEQVPIWTVGGRFNITPKGAVDVYVTNGIGTTPGTSILANWPGGDDLLIGAKLTWTPGAGDGYRESYRNLSSIDAWQKSLQMDGFTLGSADTFEPGTVSGTLWGGSNEAYGGGLALAFDRDGQFEVYAEQRADDGSVPAGLLPAGDQRYLVGLKVRLLDQNNGDAFSFSGRLLGGRNLDTGTVGVGELFAEGILSYKMVPKLAVTVNPKLGAFGNTSIYGIGLGANFEIYEGIELIGEATYVNDGNGTVWAAGARYNVPDYGLSIDASATNAVGRVGMGTMIAQDSTRFSLSVNKQFNLGNWRSMF